MDILSHYIRTIMGEYTDYQGRSHVDGWGRAIILKVSLIYILHYFNVFKIYPTKIRVGPPKHLN